MATIRVALAQVNTVVGDIRGNKAKVLAGIEQAEDLGADLVAFPELSITGYPPEDLLLKPQFVERNLKALEEIASQVPRHIVAIVGFVDKRDDIYNAAAVLNAGQVVDVYHKVHLPNYGVFDEERYFQAGDSFLTVSIPSINGAVIGITICEDIWLPGGPAQAVSLEGDAQLIININSSPYHAGKRAYRERMVSVRATDNLVALAYVNLVGGQDELVFDGGSFIVNEHGEVVARGKLFEEGLIVSDVDLEAVFRARLHDTRRRQAKAAREGFTGKLRQKRIEGFHPRIPKPPLTPILNEPLPRTAEIYHALVLGTRDYALKNGFQKVVVGLSGGIDSSLTAAIAADAVGAQNTVGVSMPGPFSSIHSLEDARQLAQNLGIEYMVIPITDVYHALLGVLSEPFKGREPDVTEENLQARIRGIILMALSNKFGWLVLTTSNKSEASVGYCTLYGDTTGGFSVIKDVPKMLVYELAEYKNESAGQEIIPRRVFEKAPSAELRPNQTDQDSLPPYPILDEILKAYVEEDKDVGEIAAMNLDEATVRRVAKMVERSEYKRRQVAPGVKITHRSLGKDRRMPITNKFCEWEEE